ncbi:MAG: hypothetical protein JWN85_2929 [Gammaproteobacteria bacterium]|nr:hypothetical protein [Gammaproteobacteria bacterium]
MAVARWRKAVDVAAMTSADTLDPNTVMQSTFHQFAAQQHHLGSA